MQQIGAQRQRRACIRSTAGLGTYLFKYIWNVNIRAGLRAYESESLCTILGTRHSPRRLGLFPSVAANASSNNVLAHRGFAGNVYRRQWLQISIFGCLEAVAVPGALVCPHKNTTRHVNWSWSASVTATTNELSSSALRLPLRRQRPHRRAADCCVVSAESGVTQFLKVVAKCCANAASVQFLKSSCWYYLEQYACDAYVFH